MMLVLSAGLLLVAAFLSSRLLRHQRVMTLLGAIGAFFELYWLLTTAIVHYLALPATGSWLVVATIITAIAAWLFYLYKQPFTWRGSGWRDVAVLFTTIIVLGGAYLAMSANGLRGTDFVIHGFYNGDTITFASLVQKALTTTTASIGNPFAAGGPLEYPTLLHRSLAVVFSSTHIGLHWLYFWPLLVYVQIVITIPLFFLLWDTFLPEPKPGERWLGVRHRSLIIGLQAALTLGLVTLSWDNYIYPQSHFFLSAIFLLLGAILFARYTNPFAALGLGAIATIALLLSNAVTGSAAAVLFILYILAVNLERRQKALYQVLSSGAIVLVAAIFVLATPGNAELGRVAFSYTAAHDMAGLISWLLLLLVGIALQFSLYRRESVAILGLAGVTFVIFIFSSRDIVVANASRFIYHALLLGLPLLLRPVLRTGWYVYREFVLSTRRVLEYVIGLAIVVIGITAFTMPSISSIASAYDNLLYNNEHKISWQRREALWWLADHTEVSSVIIANPEAPWDIPLFTGRSLLRASNNGEAYWLSLPDENLQQLQAAFAGDVAAQKNIVQHGDYLLLSAAEETSWSGSFPVVFSTKHFRIWQLK